LAIPEDKKQKAHPTESNIRFLSEVVISGTTTTTIEYYAFHSLQTTTVNPVSARIIFNAPLSDSTYMESNPFNLYLSGGNGEEGSFLIPSALLFIGPNEEPMLNQYWMIHLGENGRIDGTLQDAHAFTSGLLWQRRGRPT
jgi:hypothetical protein